MRKILILPDKALKERMNDEQSDEKCVYANICDDLFDIALCPGTRPQSPDKCEKAKYITSV